MGSSPDGDITVGTNGDVKVTAGVASNGIENSVCSSWSNSQTCAIKAPFDAVAL